MMKRQPVVFTTLVITALGMIVWLIPGVWREPVYQGKSVTFWIHSLTNSGAEKLQAEEVLGQIGLPAIPYLVAGFEMNETVYSKLWHRAPAAMRGFLPEPFSWQRINSEIAQVLGFIGRGHRFSDGVGDAPTTPQLERGVRALAHRLADPNVNVRISCAQALAFIGPNARDAGPDLLKMFGQGNSHEKIMVCQAFGTIGPCSSARQVVKVMLSGLSGADKHLQLAVVQALGAMGSEAEAAIPVLTERLTDSDGELRRAAVRSLARIGNVPKGIRPNLLLLLNETDEGTRAGAALALVRLDPSDSNALSIVKACLKGEKPANLPNLRSGTLYLMMSMGPSARPFLPELRELVAGSDLNASIFARKVLKGIPEAGAK